MESSIKCLTRKRNFSNDEIELLTTEVAKKSRVLFGKFQIGECSAALKGKAWQDVAAAVSAVGTMKRTTDEVKKKWSTLKSNAKGKASQISKEGRMTGGGPVSVEALMSAEERIVGVMGQESVSGIDGGIDINDIRYAGPSWDEWCPGHSQLVERVLRVSETSCESENVATPPAELDTLSSSIRNSVVTKENVIKNDASGNKKDPATLAVLISLQKETVNALKDIKMVNEERLAVDKQRLAVEKEMLELKKERLALYRMSLGVQNVKKTTDGFEITMCEE